MFYSQTFLARKGPLGTVWCAAHLQHRLKKSHYTSTDISSTVDRIMFPEVPIALRTSGHLLLGVVRIYSKKVEYLYHDCNVALVGLQKAFSSVDINLPANATTAKFESVTLPQTLDLDAFDVDNNLLGDGSPDNHLKSQEEITLADQVPVGRDLFIAISFDEDIIMDQSFPKHDSNAGSRAVEDERIPQSPAEMDAFFEDNDANNQTRLTNKAQEHALSSRTEVPLEAMEVQEPALSHTEVFNNTTNTPQPSPSNQTKETTDRMDFQDPGASNQMETRDSRDTGFDLPPEIEVIRDFVHDDNLQNVPPVSLPANITEQNESIVRNINEKTILSPIVEDPLPSVGLSFEKRSEPPISAASGEVREIFGNVSPELELRSTPSARQPVRRPKKRKQVFDESTVLTNKSMKKALENCSDLLRKKRLAPSSTLDVWKLKNSVRKEQIFDEPSITGMSNDISDLLKKDYISMKPGLYITREGATMAGSPACAAVSPARAAASVAEEISESANAVSPCLAEETPEPRTATANEVTQEERIVPSPTTEDMDIERLRPEEGPHHNNVLPDFLSSPARVIGSESLLHSARDDFNPYSGEHLRSEATYWVETYTGTGLLSTPNVTAPTRSYCSDWESPRMVSEERFGADTGLSDIPDYTEVSSCSDSIVYGSLHMKSNSKNQSHCWRLSPWRKAHDLNFLEADSTPASSQGTQGINSLSVRTRAVAQYLKRQSPMTPVPEDVSGELSLNNILRGKTKKLCARMFFETLVLKSYGLIDVEQDQPYGDISLKVTPTLSKAQI